MDSIRGAYGDAGKAPCPSWEPSPDIPDTLLFLLLKVDVEMLDRCIGGSGFARLEYEAEPLRVCGGVREPKVELTVDDDWDVGTVSLVTLLSVDLSVRKLAFDLRRRSFRNEGAIA